MAIVLDTVNEEVRLEFNDAEAHAAWIEFPAAPAAAKRMIFVFRAWWDTFASTTTYSAKGWNHTNYFGISFNNTVHKFANPFSGSPNWVNNPFKPDGFFGWCCQGPDWNGVSTFTYDRIGLWRDTFSPHGSSVALGQVGVSGSAYYLAFLNGIAGSIGTNLRDRNTLSTSSGNTNVALPANPTDGAKFTGYFEIKASATDKTMYASLAQNFQTLSGSDMFTAFANAGSGTAITDATIHGDVTSAFRPSFGQVLFPTFFKVRCSLPAQKLVIKELRVRYLDLAANVLQEDDLMA